MSDSEMRELDFFCAEHVFKSVRVERESPRRWRAVYLLDRFPEGIVCGSHKSEAKAWDYLWYQIKHPTTDSASAMEVLGKCAERLEEEDNEETVSIAKDGPYWIVEKTNNLKNLRTEHASRETCICLFARELFSK